MEKIKTKKKHKRFYYKVNDKQVSISSYVYYRIHLWVRKKYGKANHCEHCKTNNHKRFEWALKKGFRYSRSINNYIPLCVNCHRKYDITDEFREKCRIRIKNNNVKNTKPVKMINKRTGDVVGTFYSITEASEKTSIGITSISNVLKNRSKTAGGFIWKMIN